jgi:acetylornithine deacetylase
VSELSSADLRIVGDPSDQAHNSPQVSIRTSSSTDAQITATALAAVDSLLESAIELLGHLVAIPSMGGTEAEAEIQHVLAEILHSDGFDVDLWSMDLDELTTRSDFPGMEVERSQAFGLLATLPGHAPELGLSLLVDGHVDVVPPGDLSAWTGDPFTLERTERAGIEVLVGRGACDMKGGLVAAIMAARALNTVGVKLAGDLHIAPVVGEEDGGLGTYDLMRRGITADACVIPEPTDLDIIPANGGALTFRLRVPGQAIHASRRTEGVSAITNFTTALPALEALEKRRNADVDPLMSRWPIAYPLSIGTVHAGDWASTVPDLLTAEGRFGVALGEDPAAARTQFEECIAEVNAQDPFLREHPITVEWWGGQFESGRSDNDYLIDLTRRAHYAAAPQRQHQQVYGAPYGSDLRFISPRMPALQYGPGDASAAHAPDEFISVDSLRTSMRTYALMYLEHCHIL